MKCQRMKRQRMKRQTLKLWLAGLLFPSMCLAANVPQDFAFAVPVELHGEGALYEVAIPASIYQGALQPDLADIRVFNNAGEPVAFAFEPLPQKQATRSLPVTLPSFPLYAGRDRDVSDVQLRVDRSRTGTILSVRSETRAHDPKRTLTAVLIDASALREPYAALELDWPQKSASFAANVRLDASDDLRTWSTLAARAPLLRAEYGGRRLEQRTIEFQPQTAKYLRVTWLGSHSADTAPDEPVAFTQVTARTADRMVESTRNWREVAATKDERAGDYLFDLSGQFPVDRVRIVLPEDNTVAPIQLLSRNDANQIWRARSTTVVYRLSRNGQQITSPDVAVPTTSDRYWLLRVDPNNGGIGTGTPRLEAGWLPRKIAFAARGRGPFQIAYGSNVAASAALPIETVVPGWRSDQQIVLAKAETLPERLLGGEAVLQRRPDYKVWSLWTALVLGVALLAWMAWGLTRQMHKPTSPEGKDSGAEQ